MAKYEGLKFTPDVTHDRNLLVRELKTRTAKFPFLTRYKNDDNTFHVSVTVGDFTFTVRHPTVVSNNKGNVVSYECVFFPKTGGTGTLARGNYNGDRIAVLSKYDKWCMYVNSILAAVEEDEENPNFQQIKREIEEEFMQSAEPIADDEVLPDDRQQLLYDYLDTLKRYLQERYPRGWGNRIRY
ncbi:MAG TPA: hypothetical protein VK625_01560 [Flavitalea sp.]|nr:hypothetical protein [Flavitalea sp.]